MRLHIENLPDAIRTAKTNLRRALPNYAGVFHEVEREMQQRAADIARDRDAGRAVIPAVEYADIERGSVAPSAVAAIKDRGACIIRRVFAPEQVDEWRSEETTSDI